MAIAIMRASPVPAASYPAFTGRLGRRSLVVMTFCRRAPGSPPAVHAFRRLRWRGGCRRRGVALEEGGNSVDQLGEMRRPLPLEHPTSIGIRHPRAGGRRRCGAGAGSHRVLVARRKKSVGIDCKARPNNSRAGTQESPTRPATSGLGSAVGWLPGAATPLSRAIYPKVNRPYPFGLEAEPRARELAAAPYGRCAGREV